YSRIAYCFGPTVNYVFLSWALNGSVPSSKRPNDMSFFLGVERFSVWRLLIIIFPLDSCIKKKMLGAERFSA
ncbi:hypothetical protein GIB67_041895, partial [Kingdonia uniflora]